MSMRVSVCQRERETTSFFIKTFSSFSCSQGEKVIQPQGGLSTSTSTSTPHFLWFSCLTQRRSTIFTPFPGANKRLQAKPSYEATSYFSAVPAKGNATDVDVKQLESDRRKKNFAPHSVKI